MTLRYPGEMSRTEQWTFRELVKLGKTEEEAAKQIQRGRVRDRSAVLCAKSERAWNQRLRDYMDATSRDIAKEGE